MGCIKVKAVLLLYTDANTCGSPSSAIMAFSSWRRLLKKAYVSTLHKWCAWWCELWVWA